MPKRILTAAALLFSFPALSSERPIELYCSGYLEQEGQKIGRASLSITLDREAREAIVTGLPYFAPYAIPLIAEAHQYSAVIPGMKLYLDRLDQSLLYEFEGLSLTGSCERSYTLL